MKGQYECHHLVNNFPQMPVLQNEGPCQLRDRISCIMMSVLIEQVPEGTETSLSETQQASFFIYFIGKNEGITHRKN